MDKKSLYESLAKHLDQGIIAAAESPTLLKMLKILYPGVEAEIAVNLPFENKTMVELNHLFPDKADMLNEIIHSMVKRGTVFTQQRPGEEMQYSLLPILVGWAETPYWAGKDTETARKLAPLWLKYREEAFGNELARGIPTVRVIPVSKSLKNESEILPFDILKDMIEKLSFCAVGHCPCRQIMRYNGRGCNHTLENCLHFGSMGRHMVAQGMARKISKEETLKIVYEADQEGLVHVCENIDGHLGTICNCCSCCCVFLNTKKTMGLSTFSPSNYTARVDQKICAGCGICEERCPMEAVTLEGDTATVNEALCIGCGVCTPTCSTEAIRLVQRDAVKPPPDISKFLEVRYKT